MRCTRCGKDYRTSLDDEKLITRGLIDQHCPKCGELEQYAHKRPGMEQDPVNVGWDGAARLPGRIFRVEVYDATGVKTTFMEIDRTPQVHVGNVIDEPRRGNLRVRVVHPERREYISNHLAPRINTNLMGVLQTGRNLWFERFPSYADLATGIDKIRVKRSRIKSIEFESGLRPEGRFEFYDAYVKVRLTDGELAVTLERSPRHRAEAHRLIVPKKPIGTL